METIGDRIKSSEICDILDIDTNEIGFKLQRIVEFSFEPGKGIINQISSIANISEKVCVDVFTRIRRLKLEVVNYSDDLTFFKYSYWGDNKSYGSHEDIDWPKTNAWLGMSDGNSSDDKFFNWGGELLFQYNFEGDTISLYDPKLRIGYNPDPEKFVAYVSTKGQDHLLFEIPFYNEWLEKHSTIDKNRMFRMYSNGHEGSKETNPDFHWDLKIVEHPDLIAWKEKYEKSNR